MKAKNIFFIVTLSLFLSLPFIIPNVFSITEDFIGLAPNSTITACRGTIVENEIKIGNTGNINSLYSITQKGEAAKWSVIRPLSFNLEKGEVKALVNPINIPSDVDTGAYSLLTYIETGFGLKKVITQSIAVERCASEEPVIEPEVNETAEVDHPVDLNETEQSDERSRVIDILRWIAYAALAFVVIIIIIIIALYGSEAKEEPLEEETEVKPEKRSERKAAAAKTKNAVKKQSSRNTARPAKRSRKKR